MNSRVILSSVAETPVETAVVECLDFCNWERAIPSGGTVVIKPNLCTAVADRAESANTSVRLTSAVCDVLLTRARQIYLVEADNLRQKAEQAFEISGYAPLAKRPGIQLANLSALPCHAVDCPGVGKVDMPRLLLGNDAFITLPVLKTHALTYFTGALKNQWGCVPRYDRILLHRYLDEMLVWLHRILRPKFAIMDGIVAVEGRGPVNGRPRKLDLILASEDSVALDAAAMRLVSLEPARARHVMLAAEQGLGVADESRIQLEGPWRKCRTKFAPAVLDGAIRAMNHMSRYRWFVKYILQQDYLFYPSRSVVQFLRGARLIAGASR